MTDELLDANFIASGQARIDLLSPTENQQITNTNPAFSWSARSPNLYTLEIASDPDFGSIIVKKDIAGNSYTLANSDLSGIGSLVTAAYYWRVKMALTSNNLLSKTGSFFLIAIPTGGSGHAGTIYVNGNGGNSVQNGSVALPYKLIQAGIEAADSLRSSNGNITFEIRVAQGTYNEEVNLKPGINLKGGYDSTNWLRNPNTNVTTIIGKADSGVRANVKIILAYRSTTIVDGFHIYPGNIATATQGIGIFGGSPTIMNNVISGGTGSFNGFGIYINSTAQPLIINNIITGGTGAGSNYGIQSNGVGPNALIYGNTINGGGTGSGGPSAVSFRAGATGSVKNNILFNGPGSGNCINENDSGSDPVEVMNNNLFSCAVLYFDEGSTNIVSMATAISNPSGSLSSFGNVNIANTSNQLFLNINGPDGNIVTLTDNDWHLTNNAAICNVRGGGLNLSASFTTDKDGLTRTISAISGCAPSNTGATNWSIGAYESN